MMYDRAVQRIATLCIFFHFGLLFTPVVDSFSSKVHEALAGTSVSDSSGSFGNRRTFFTKTVGSVATVAVFTGGTAIDKANAANAVKKQNILNTPNGIKYAVLEKPNKGGYPQTNDIVAIEYTGYLTDGTIFDASHSIGKANALTFKLGSKNVLPAFNEMAMEMTVLEKVQAIVPPSMAFGDKGVCLENGECLIKPDTTLVYDIYLKRIAIPPP